MQAAKREFLIYELGLLSLKAALSTRAGGAPIYARSCKEHQRGATKDGFRAVLHEVLVNYSSGTVDEEQHVYFIANTAERFTKRYSKTLHQGRLRFGVAQKLINMHLKYLWVAGIIDEPIHCPIDGIVRDLAGLQYDWTSSDSQDEYLTAISHLKRVAASRSLAVWELEEFRRRAQ
ncbi:hypothetical protein EYS42_16790 [Aquabacterium lacunae]|uniref:Uncharacterized protein n=1 Tax=Aquabacterium lacunae TaxID=2528630 RepID=A0A4Q9GUE8_9BURK|nr:hypothetical protein [Aquabacterium lacunae]TBO27464.1 hypothetical protein EYS42_16790 [Aquabacterium lacunae]